jgi:hypothetical protein
VEVSSQLRGQRLSPGARLAICLRLTFVRRIAIEANGIRALVKDFLISGRQRAVIELCC